MASTAQHITRDQLNAVFGGNTRAIRLFESLVQEVAVTLPAAIDEVQLSTLFSLHGADGSKGASNHAAALAMEVQTLTDACRRQASDINALREQIDLLRAELNDCRSRLASAIGKLQTDVANALTLTTGV